jgi:hypothetical protein
MKKSRVRLDVAWGALFIDVLYRNAANDKLGAEENVIFKWEICLLFLF